MMGKEFVPLCGQNQVTEGRGISRGGDSRIWYPTDTNYFRLGPGNRKGTPGRQGLMFPLDIQN